MSGTSKGNREVELEVFNRFSQIVREKFTSLADGGNGDDGGAGKDRIDRIDSLYKRPEFSAEKRILNDLSNMGLHKGVLSGVACFAFLRLSPWAISRMLQRRAARAGGMGDNGIAANNPFRQSPLGYEFDPPAAVGIQPNSNGRPGLFFRILRLSLDTFVSLSIGAYASLYFIDKDKMMKQFAEIPLVEGVFLPLLFEL